MITKYNEYIKESIDPYFLQTLDETIKWLEIPFSQNIKVNHNDLKVNADYITMSKMKLSKISVQFDIVQDFFDCEKNNLTSLKGCPEIVNGDMDCSDNNLKSLKYCPKIITGAFTCNNNPLEDINDLNPKILDRCMRRTNTWIYEIKQEVWDKYFEYCINKDSNVINILKDKVSEDIKQKYSHLFNANNFNLF